METIPVLAKVLRALANKRRLVILAYLKSEGRASVSEIARHIRLSIKSTSHHLAVMSAAEIVGREQQGLFVHYSIHQKLHLSAKYIVGLL